MSISEVSDIYSRYELNRMLRLDCLGVWGVQ